jgi:hypothetical protein
MRVEALDRPGRGAAEADSRIDAIELVYRRS